MTGEPLPGDATCLYRTIPMQWGILLTMQWIILRHTVPLTGARMGLGWPWHNVWRRSSEQASLRALNTAGEAMGITMACCAGQRPWGRRG